MTSYLSCISYKVPSIFNLGVKDGNIQWSYKVNDEIALYAFLFT